MSTPASASASVVALRGRDPYAPSADDKRRQQEMQRAWEAYNGIFHGGTPQWPLLWKTGKEPNPNVLINRCGPAADTDVAWLMGETIGISLGDDAPAAAQEYVNQVWGVSTEDSSDDDKMALLQELATNGAICGTAYVKIVWDEESARSSGQEFPELVVLDSTMVRVKTAPHNAKVPICYIIEYQIPDPDSGDAAMGTFREVIELNDKDGVQKLTGKSDPDDVWMIQDYYRPPRSTVFAPSGQPQQWPYPWAPIEGCPHIAKPNSYYGRPRITPDVIHINEAICTVASNINKIGIRHGHPILYTIKQGANQKTLRHEPGTIMEVSSDVKAVEAHGDLEHLMAFESDLRADFDEETHVPAQAFGRQTEIPRTPVSGVSIRLGYGPLMADITKERRTYGALIRRVTKHLLQLKNESWGDYPVTLNWQDPLPADDLQQAQVVQAADAIGIISKQTAAEKFGLNWEIEQQHMQDEAADAMTAALQGRAWPSPDEPAQPTAPGQPSDGTQPPQSQQPTPPAAPGAPAQQQPPQPRHLPPTNHPAAVAQRNATAAVAKVLKAGGGAAK